MSKRKVNRIELVAKLSKELKEIEGVLDVEEVEGYYPSVDAFLKIVVDPLSLDIAEKVSDKIAKIQVEYLEKMGKMPVIEWDVVGKEAYETITKL